MPCGLIHSASPGIPTEVPEADEKRLPFSNWCPCVASLAAPLQGKCLIVMRPEKDNHLRVMDRYRRFRQALGVSDALDRPKSTPCATHL
jgi:hypothetical protein